MFFLFYESKNLKSATHKVRKRFSGALFDRMNAVATNASACLNFVFPHDDREREYFNNMHDKLISKSEQSGIDLFFIF
jgi:hypothetical protein